MVEVLSRVWDVLRSNCTTCVGSLSSFHDFQPSPLTRVPSHLSFLCHESEYIPSLPSCLMSSPFLLLFVHPNWLYFPLEQPSCSPGSLPPFELLTCQQHGDPNRGGLSWFPYQVNGTIDFERQTYLLLGTNEGPHRYIGIEKYNVRQKPAGEM